MYALCAIFVKRGYKLKDIFTAKEFGATQKNLYILVIFTNEEDNADEFILSYQK